MIKNQMDNEEVLQESNDPCESLKGNNNKENKKNKEINDLHQEVINVEIEDNEENDKEENIEDLKASLLNVPGDMN